MRSLLEDTFVQIWCSSPFGVVTARHLFDMTLAEEELALPKTDDNEEVDF